MCLLVDLQHNRISSQSVVFILLQDTQHHKNIIFELLSKHTYTNLDRHLELQFLYSFLGKLPLIFAI